MEPKIVALADAKELPGQVRPFKRGAPSDVRRWPHSYTIRVLKSDANAFRQACFDRKVEPADVLRKFMQSFVDRSQGEPETNS